MILIKKINKTKMKTSNKLLTAALSFIVLLGLVAMITTRASLVPRGIGDGDELITGSGEVQKKRLEVASFSKLLAMDGLAFTIVAGEEFVEIEAEENLLDYFETVVEGDRLQMNIKEGYSLNPSPEKKIKVTVGYENLHNIRANANASVVSQDTLFTESLSLNATSGSRINIQAITKNLDLTANSAGQIILAGSTSFIKGSANSGGAIKAEEVTSITGEVNSNSGGQINVFVRDYLEASANSGGSIRYKGDPKVDQRSNSGGSIYKG